MNGWIRAGIFGVGAALSYCVWQNWELKRFGVTNYEAVTGKVKEEHRIVVLADLHGFSYGKGNCRLLAAVRRQRPELILIAGDLIVSKSPQTYGRALETLKALKKIAPVYYGLGNHESRAASRPAVSGFFEEYRQAAEKLGVVFLQNQSADVRLGQDVVSLSGLELPLSYYERGRMKSLEPGVLADCLGKPSRGLTLLLAHNPAYSGEYAAWGADITFCGHNHGGLVRIPGIGGLISPQLRPFPRYGEGMHEIRGKRVIISRGLGTHTFHVRIFNRAELVCLTLAHGRRLEADKKYLKING